MELGEYAGDQGFKRRVCEALQKMKDVLHISDGLLGGGIIEVVN